MANGFTWHKDGSLVYLTADHLTASGLVRHGFSTRHGGVSTGAVSGLNLGFKNGDEVQVLENRRRFLTALGLDFRALVAGQQVHGTRVAEVRAEDSGRGARAWEEGLPATDALITDVSGLPLSVYTADCVPLLFLDPVRPAVAAVHAGWRGSVAGIAPAALAALRAAYDTQPNDVLVAIGPSIGPCCYEVDEKVIVPLRSLPFWREVAVVARPGHWYLDLWELNRRQLLAAGVPAENIAVARLCTSCHVKDFYSYRAEHGRTGSLAAVISLKP
ncbi:MAG: purine-nucleoside/S-methyl-5-thioadenosine phosphorylase / adenosine deaminase [Bacillota bacterium]|nr:purine-nucleoside/S-methyl-5-thioadenosine phosphorylase / adenosine deaminase [Bacillota bacterium]MDK2960068.1 purine-nucleoside/S-methyl-5-thioadenosine phosphorylase / adenosine deaminase [Bacillota bacterium]